MSPRSEFVLVIGSSERFAPVEAVRPSLDQEGLEVRHLVEDGDRRGLEAILQDDALPAAVVLADDLERPLTVARRVHHLASGVQIVFVARPEGADRLRSQMSVAPRIGTHWSIVDPTPDALLPALVSAVQATRQRLRLRTTLERINSRLQEPPPAEDSATYQRLVVSDRYLASVLEHAGDAILALDRNERIRTWNRGAVQLFGYAAVDALERSVDLLVAPEDSDRLHALIQLAWEGHASTGRELMGTRADDDQFDAAVTTAPMWDDQGGVESVVVIVRDITERKRVEAERIAANQRLTRALEALEASERELRELNAQLEIQATTDALTGLKNRIVFHNSLTEMIAVAQRSGGALSLLLLDVDHFKRINDEWGHLEGDRVLKKIASRVKDLTREQDVVARFGGEEFAVLLPNTGLDDAMLVAEKLRVGCATSVAGGSKRITVSVGVATYEPGDSESTFIDRADRGLYMAKESGRDAVAQIRTEHS